MSHKIEDRLASLTMQGRARKRIPGGTQLLSKRPEMFAPGQWPGYYSRAKGVETWDLDGNRYIDMSISGIGASVLGFADPDVNAAVRAAIDAGTNCSLNCPEEVELAELLCQMHGWAEMVRYARSGGESMAIAVRIARAHTRRDKVAFCGYHGWHDWYLAANLKKGNRLDQHLLPGLAPLGVPRGLAGTALPFRYNHIEDLEKIISKNKNDLAAIVMEPVRDHYPQADFLEKVRIFASEIGAVLVFDEITAALRLNSAGSHLVFNVEPDMAVFAKAISNGFPMGAVIGREAVMQSAQSTFISSTYWTERIGPVAALATLKKHQRLDVAKHLIKIGRRIQSGWELAAQQAGLKINIGGIPPLSHFAFAYDNGQAMMTLFTQLMLARGFLASGRFYATYAHTDVHVENYLKALQEIFTVIAGIRETGDVEQNLCGPIAHSGFHRLT
jgi:glutamate-1-semialdehyde 2,1-aminomutase